jgi:hypothetical protein
MFRPFSAAASASASPPPHYSGSVQLDRPPSPLTSRKLAGMEGFHIHPKNNLSHADCSSRSIMVGNLGLIHCDKATQSEKVEFINQVAGRINAMPSDQITTIVSLGSSALLVEDLIFKQLSAEHQKNTQFRLIDPDYMQDRPFYEWYTKAIGDFSSSKKAKPFVTSTDYLSKVVDGKRLADTDREQGPVFILSVNPPSKLGQLDPRMLSECLLVRGVSYPPRMIDKANAVLLRITDSSERLRLAAQKLDSFRTHYLSDYEIMSMICYPDQQDKLHFQSAPYAIAQLFFYDIKGMIQREKDLLLNPEGSPLNILYRVALSVAIGFESQNDDVKLEVSIVSGYDRSVGELNEHFASSPHHAVFASLENNQIEIKELKPPAESITEHGSSSEASSTLHESAPPGLEAETRIAHVPAAADDEITPAEIQPSLRQRRRARSDRSQESVSPTRFQAADQTHEEASRRWGFSTLLGMGALGLMATINAVAQYQGRNERASTPLTPGDLSQLPTQIVPSFRRDPDCYPHCLAEGDNAGVERVLGKAFAHLQKTFGDVKGNPFTNSKFVDIEFADQPRQLLPEYLREVRSKGEDPKVLGAVVHHQMVEHRPGAKPQLVPRDLLARCPDAADICLQGEFIYQMLRKEVHINMGWASQAYGLDIDGKIDFDNAIIMAMQLRPGGKRPPYFLEQKGISPSHKKWAVTADGKPASLFQFSRHLEARFGAGNLRQAKLGKGYKASELGFKIDGNDGLLQILEDSVRGRPQVLTPAQSRN